MRRGMAGDYTGTRPVIFLPFFFFDLSLHRPADGLFGGSNQCNQKGELA